MTCFVFSRLSAAFLLFSVSSVLLLCRCFFCILSSAVFLSVFLWRCMFLYCFLPVSLVLLAFFLCPTPGCRAYRDPGVEHAETRMSDMSRPGCHTMPFRISVFSFSFPLFSFARMRIYYNVSLLSGFSSSLKIYVLQHICQSAFYKKCLRKTRKNPLIYLACML